MQICLAVVVAFVLFGYRSSKAGAIFVFFVLYSTRRFYVLGVYISIIKDFSLHHLWSVRE